MIAPDDMQGVGASDLTAAALGAALADLERAEVFNAAVRADVETVIVEVTTAWETGSWAHVFPTSGKSHAERRDHVGVLRDVAGLEPHAWVNPLT